MKTLYEMLQDGEYADILRTIQGYVDKLLDDAQTLPHEPQDWALIRSYTNVAKCVAFICDELREDRNQLAAVTAERDAAVRERDVARRAFEIYVNGTLMEWFGCDFMGYVVSSETREAFAYALAEVEEGASDAE